jgi:hypothetical protein
LGLWEGCKELEVLRSETQCCTDLNVFGPRSAVKASWYLFMLPHHMYKIWWRVSSSGIWRRVVRWMVPEEDTLQNHRCENLKSKMWFCQLVYPATRTNKQFMRTQRLKNRIYFYDRVEGGEYLVQFGH